MPTSVDLPEYFINTFGAMMVLKTGGYSFDDVTPMVCHNAILFRVKMGDSLKDLLVAMLPDGVSRDRVMRNWGSAMEVWNALPTDEMKMLVAGSGAVERVSAFLSACGNSPTPPDAQGPVDVPCPWCKRILRSKGGALLNDLKVAHEQPACPEFKAAGPAVAMKLAGDRIRHQMMTMGQGREYSDDCPKVV